ncbi:secreted RxLR effector protein 161-like [Aristolochia californica]|uniref:secreted RxLR effector protein 161-like n=1 Tax=Aristolochia californica TaxID=171875 RepID=UPI0035DE619F
MANVPCAYAIGGLMYVMVCTRPDIDHAVGIMNRYMSNPDADMVEDIDGRKSTIGYVYTLGGTTVSWVSNLQKIVALFTTEAEYVIVIEANKEMLDFSPRIEKLLSL